MSAPASLLCENLISTLVARRELLGMSQRELALAIGAAPSQVSEWESGTHSPSLACLIRWAQALDLFVRFIPYASRKRAIKRTIDMHRQRPDRRRAA